MRRTAMGSWTTSCPSTAQLPAVGLDERGHHADEGGLAGAVRAEDGDRLAGGQGEGQFGEGLDLPESLGEAVGLDEGVHGRASFRRAVHCLHGALGEPVRRRSPTLRSAASGEGPSWIGLVVVWARGRVVQHAAPGHSGFVSKLKCHLLGVEVLGVEEPPHVESLELPGRHLLHQGADEPQLGDDLLLLVLGLQLEQARQPCGLRAASMAPRMPASLTVSASRRGPAARPGRRRDRAPG